MNGGHRWIRAIGGLNWTLTLVCRGPAISWVICPGVFGTRRGLSWEGAEKTKTWRNGGGSGCEHRERELVGDVAKTSLAVNSKKFVGLESCRTRFLCGSVSFFVPLLILYIWSVPVVMEDTFHREVFHRVCEDSCIGMLLSVKSMYRSVPHSTTTSFWVARPFVPHFVYIFVCSIGLASVPGCHSRAR